MNVYINPIIWLAYFTIFVKNGQIMPDLLNLQKYKKKTLLQNFSAFIGTQNFCNVLNFVSASENQNSKPNSIKKVIFCWKLLFCPFLVWSIYLFWRTNRFWPKCVFSHRYMWIKNHVKFHWEYLFLEALVARTMNFTQKIHLLFYQNFFVNSLSA